MLPRYSSKQGLYRKFRIDLNEFERLYDDANRLLSEYQSLPKAKRPKSKDVGDAFEKLANYLFSCCEDVFEPHGSLRTAASQIDNLISVHSYPDSFLKEWPPAFFLEAKNWSKKMSKPAIADFIHKGMCAKFHVGIAFSRHGVTGRGLRDASAAIFTAAAQCHYIIVISEEHLNEVKNGKNFLRLLELLYCNCRALTS